MNVLNNVFKILVMEFISSNVSKEQAMKRAKQMILQKKFYSKAAGVTFENRQQLLERLNCYKPSDVILQLVAEPTNKYDRNAVKIIAVVKNKGFAHVGYVPKNTAPYISSILQAGYQLSAQLENITFNNGTYGFNFSFSYRPIRCDLNQKTG